MRTVYTEEGLREALTTGESNIVVKGALADKMIKRKRRARIGTALTAVAAVAAIPFTGGTSALGLGAAATISTEAVILTLAGMGTSLAMVGLIKGYNVKMDYKNQTVELEKK